MACVIKKVRSNNNWKNSISDKDNVLPESSVPATELFANDNNKIEGIIL